MPGHEPDQIVQATAIEVFTAEIVGSAEKGTAHTSAGAVVGAHFLFYDNLFSVKGHFFLWKSRTIAFC